MLQLLRAVFAPTGLSYTRLDRLESMGFFGEKVKFMNVLG